MFNLGIVALERGNQGIVCLFQGQHKSASKEVPFLNTSQQSRNLSCLFPDDGSK
jgi:hypothetical protein